MATSAMTTGCIFSAREIKARLDVGTIFRRDTWKEDNIRAAAYDLRMAKDLVVVPDRPRFASGRFYPRGEERTKDVILEPGDIAFLSTMERVILPWDVGARVGMKFGLAARGILTLTGSFVDPGYGLFFNTEAGDWVGREDQRLHFLFANVGGGAVAFRPGDEIIASIEFFSVEHPQRKKETPSRGYLEIKDNLPDPDRSVDTGLIFFRNVVDMGSRIADVQTAVDAVRKEVGGIDGKVKTIETGTNQIVMFGIYLLCITFIALFLTSILASINTQGWGAKIEELHRLVVDHPMGLLALILMSVGIAAILFVIITALGKLVRVFSK